MLWLCQRLGMNLTDTEGCQHILLHMHTHKQIITHRWVQLCHLLPQCTPALKGQSLFLLLLCMQSHFWARENTVGRYGFTTLCSLLHKSLCHKTIDAVLNFVKADNQGGLIENEVSKICSQASAGKNTSSCLFTDLTYKNCHSLGNLSLCCDILVTRLLDN